MNIANKHSDDTNGGGKSSPCVELSPDALPEVRKPFLAEDSQTGASTRNAPIGTETIAGKLRIEKSRLPNIFFAYDTEDELKTYVYDNVNIPYPRFYYHSYIPSAFLEKAIL